jgi:phage gp36-like protein
MSYIVEADLSARASPAQLIQLTDDEKTGVADSTRILALLVSAEAEVNSYLATRYPVPLSPVPDLVKELALDVAVYKLFARRQRVTADVRQTYEDALKKLEQIAKGVLTLGVDPPPASSTLASQGEVLTADRDFSRSAMGDF